MVNALDPFNTTVPVYRTASGSETYTLLPGPTWKANIVSPLNVNKSCAWLGIGSGSRCEIRFDDSASSGIWLISGQPLFLPNKECLQNLQARSTVGVKLVLNYFRN